MLALATLLAAGSIACTSPAKDAPAGTSSPEPAQSAEAFTFPNVTTPAAELAPDGHKHFQLFRIRRDFGKSDFEIALDAWTPADNPSQVDDVRLWWFKSSKDGERGPFSNKTKRHFDIAYTRKNAGRWSVKLLAKRGKEFTFDVQAKGGEVFAFGDVAVDGGGLVEHCKVSSGELRAKKVLGLTTGIKELAVTCTDAKGNEHHGKLAS